MTTLKIRDLALSEALDRATLRAARGGLSLLPGAPWVPPQQPSWPLPSMPAPYWPWQPSPWGPAGPCGPAEDPNTTVTQERTIAL